MKHLLMTVSSYNLSFSLLPFILTLSIAINGKQKVNAGMVIVEKSPEIEKKSVKYILI